jgi:hypothetical protein
MSVHGESGSEPVLGVTERTGQRPPLLVVYLTPAIAFLNSAAPS